MNHAAEMGGQRIGSLGVGLFSPPSDLETYGRTLQPGDYAELLAQMKADERLFVRVTIRSVHTVISAWYLGSPETFESDRKSKSEDAKLEYFALPAERFAAWACDSWDVGSCMRYHRQLPAKPLTEDQLIVGLEFFLIDSPRILSIMAVQDGMVEFTSVSASPDTIADEGELYDRVEVGFFLNNRPTLVVKSLDADFDYLWSTFSQAEPSQVGLTSG